MLNPAMLTGRRVIAVGMIRRTLRRTTRLVATPAGVTGTIIPAPGHSALRPTTVADCAADYQSPTARRLRGGAA